MAWRSAETGGGQFAVKERHVQATINRSNSSSAARSSWLLLIGDDSIIGRLSNIETRNVGQGLKLGKQFIPHILQRF